ncbi:hypothetical protein G4X40_09235 [Rhodococcus sp. D2-41]|nr:LpqN/LpqT family lipoprotein [Rhodococcus sp. D2-41]MDG3010335.1 hypothetical protein [Rhodococcus sp. D2-41]
MCLPCGRGDPAHPGVSIPQLPGWEMLPDEAFPSASLVLAYQDRISDGWCPDAVVLQGKLLGAFDAAELLDHVYRDAHDLPSWVGFETGTGAWNGHPSMFLRGTYTVGDWHLAAATRTIVYEGRGGVYLTQLTTTVMAGQLDELDIDLTVMHTGLMIT